MAEGKTTTTKKNDVTLKVQKLYENAPLPVKPTTDTDAGFDIVAHNLKHMYINMGSNGERKIEGDDLAERFVSDGVFELRAGERCLIGTGLKMTVGEGYEIQVRPRSGLALKKGLTVVNTPGTIDEAYRNEVGVIILNTSRMTQTIELGERIAQIVPKKVELLEIEECEIPDNTERGLGGFGSSNEKPEDKKDRKGRLFNDNVLKPIPTAAKISDTPFNFM